MIRFRLLFVLLAVGLLVPIGLIVARTLQAMEVERSKEHEALAARTFDEMQLALDDVLAAEEARPPGEYKPYFLPVGEEAPRRSALADLPYPSYVVGYFELDADRRFQTPLIITRNVQRGERESRLAELRALVEESWPREADARAQMQQAVQKPASTVALKGESPAQKSLGVLEGIKQIGRSNRARAQKKRTPQKFKTKAQNVYESNSLSSVRDVSIKKRSAPERDNATIDVNVDPMVSRTLGPGRLALYRTVWSPAGTVRQGLVIDVAKLGEWLQVETLADTDFAQLLEVRTGLEPRVGEEVAGSYVFQHRFTEPFSALHAGIGMPVLPGTRDNGIWMLTLVVVVAVFGGLFAAYRMVATRVAYALRRSNFVSAVTHELKTPLTVIRMYSEMLESDMLESEEKRREYYRTIGAESDRLGRLINNVLELSKIERGDRQLDLVSGRVRTVLDDVLDMLRPHAEATGFALEVHAGDDLPPIRYDRDALIQIVFNLVDNALKYARSASTKTVVLEARREGDHVALVVRDFGPGIPSAHLKRVFEPFYRPENELTRTSKGTGIGLALVKNLAEEMGGTVSGRNLPDGGFEVVVGLAAV